MQKEAILKRQTLGRRMHGTWRLTDNATGQLVDEKQQTLAKIPYFNRHGATIHNGTEYVLANQARLKPGVYTREQDSGDFESHCNVLQGDGVSHRYYLDPAKSQFFMRVGQAKLPLMPLMRAFGVSNDELRKAWGPEILAANAADDDPRGLNKLFEKFASSGDKRKTLDDRQKLDAIRAAFGRMKLDPQVTQRTLGRPHETMSAEAVLDTTRKLLAVSRGEARADDRDHLANQVVFGPEDLIAERIRRDYGGARRTLLFKSGLRGNLSAVQPGALNRQVESALLASGLGQAAEEVNALEMLDKQYKLTRMGEGGISNVDAIPSECYDDETEVFTALGWIPWSSVTKSTRLAWSIAKKKMVEMF